jgi:hypothetical protein
MNHNPQRDRAGNLLFFGLITLCTSLWSLLLYGSLLYFTSHAAAWDWSDSLQALLPKLQLATLLFTAASFLLGGLLTLSGSYLYNKTMK